MYASRRFAAVALSALLTAAGAHAAPHRRSAKPTPPAPAAAPSVDAPAAAVTPAADAPAAADVSAGPPPMTEAVAALINDEIISTYDLRQRVRLLIISSGVQVTQQNLPEIEREALKGLVDERLQMQEIHSVEKKQKSVHLMPSKEEVDEDVAGFAKQFNVKPAQLIASLRNAGVDESTLRDQITASIAWRRYIGGRFRDNVHVNDQQVDAAITRINAASAKPQYLVSEVFLDAQRVGGQQQAQDGAAQLVDQLRKGAPFPAVARQFSSLPTAANGGDSGWLSSGEMQPVLERALAVMRPGQVSDPVPTPDGVYILQLRDKRAGGSVQTVTLKQAAIRLAPDAPADQVVAAQVELTALRDDAHGCDQLPAAAAKVNGVVVGDLGEVNPTDLSPDFKAVVDTLKPGQVGGPVRTKAGLHLLAVCSRQTGVGKTPSRADIENRLYGEQLSMIERRYLRDLKNSAEIETR